MKLPCISNFVIVSDRAIVPDFVSVWRYFHVIFFPIEVLFVHDFEWHRRDSSVLVSLLNRHERNKRCKVLFQLSQVESDVVFIELGVVVVLHVLTDLR
jgi:hypothetical protein